MIGRCRRPVRECAHNLLDNSDFRNPVNQRGQTSYTSGWAMSIDRWYVADSRGAGESAQTLTIVNGGIKMNGDYPALAQHIPLLDADKQYTLATKFSNGETHISRFAGANVNVDAGGFASVTIYFTDGLIAEWAALYEGEHTAETLPPYVPKGYAAELLECQRYFYIPPNGGGAISYVGYSNSATNARITIPLPVPMRATPSITIVTLSNINIYTGTGSRSCTDYSINNIHGNGIAVNFTTSGLSEWTPCVCRLNTNVYISAEL